MTEWSEDQAGADSEAEQALWCATCEQALEDDELTPEGNCPTCGESMLGRRKVPWTFKLMIVATVVYLGYRVYQGIGWLLHHG
ncbi:MAG TPA: hypothetical protein VEJ87_01395 [Acidimicrobiales bacterium]|nr:hypothetical protein [Acidimicrobiales bacterium]